MCLKQKKASGLLEELITHHPYKDNLSHAKGMGAKGMGVLCSCYCFIIQAHIQCYIPVCVHIDIAVC